MWQSTAIHIDEIAVRKGHKDFETIIYTEEEVIETMCGKKSLDLQELLKRIPGIGNIQQVCMDMCSSFADAVRTALPQAEIVLDRFHLIKLLNKTLEHLRAKADRVLKAEYLALEREIKQLEKEEKEIRLNCSKATSEENKEQLDLQEKAIREQKAEKSKELKAKGLRNKRFSQIRFVLSKDYAHLHKDDKRLVREYLRLHDDVQKVYWLCQDLRKILFAENKQPQTEISIQLTDWCTRARKYLGRFVKTLESWWQEVLNACFYPLNNGRAEGVNNKIKVIKRMAFGFRNRLNFKRRIQAACNP